MTVSNGCIRLAVLGAAQAAHQRRHRGKRMDGIKALQELVAMPPWQQVVMPSHSTTHAVPSPSPSGPILSPNLTLTCARQYASGSA